MLNEQNIFIMNLKNLRRKQTISDASNMCDMCYKKTFKEELECIQEHLIIILLGVNEIVEHCNHFVLVPKPNGNVKLCLDPVRLNQVPIRPIHRCLTVNDIFPRLM